MILKCPMKTLLVGDYRYFLLFRSNACACKTESRGANLDVLTAPTAVGLLKPLWQYYTALMGPVDAG